MVDCSMRRSSPPPGVPGRRWIVWFCALWVLAFAGIGTPTVPSPAYAAPSATSPQADTGGDDDNPKTELLCYWQIPAYFHDEQVQIAGMVICLTAFAIGTSACRRLRTRR